MELNIIRSIIFLIAGLILIIFPNKILKLQKKVIEKLKIKYQGDSKKTVTILGIFFLIISLALFLISVL